MLLVGLRRLLRLDWSGGNDGLGLIGLRLSRGVGGSRLGRVRLSVELTS